MSTRRASGREVTQIDKRANDETCVTSVNGWRLWLTASAPDSSAALVPPLACHLPAAQIALPGDGVIRAVCDLGHAPPHPDCECGVYFIQDAHTMVEWAARFDFLDSPHVAL